MSKKDRKLECCIWNKLPICHPELGSGVSHFSDFVEMLKRVQHDALGYYGFFEGC